MTECGGGLHRAFEQSAARAPGAVAAVDEAGEWTYGELDERATAVASRLLDLGVAPGQPVGVHLPHARPLAAALLGVLKAGGACLPLEPVLPAARLEWMAQDAGAQVVITGAGERPAIEGVRMLDLDVAHAWAGPPGLAALPEVDGDSAAYVIYTSGSTGQPKGVLVPHRGLHNHQHAAVGLYGLHPDDAVLQLSSIGFDISIEEMFPTWAAGGRVVFHPAGAPLSGSAFLGRLDEAGVTVLDLPTAFWHEWVRDLSASSCDLPRSLRGVIVGGERASAAVFRRWRSLAGERVRWWNTYGPTEASVIATAWEAPAGDLPADVELPIGQPVSGVTVHLLDEGGLPVGDGEAGEVFIGGPGVALGYLNRPDLTAERFVVDPSGGGRLYRTGDLAAWSTDWTGRRGLAFRGRTDDQVKIHGFRVEPGEIEAALAALDGVDQAVVVARPARDGGQRLAGYLVAQDGATLDPAGILRLLPERLPLHMVPSSLDVLPALPLTPNGKVDRKALPERSTRVRSVEARAVPPRDALDRALIDIWREVLELDEVGIEDDFFELGGHSLGAVRMVAIIGWLMGVEVPMSVLLERPTLQHLADRIRSGELRARGGVVQPVRAEGSRPPLLYVCTVETGVVALRHVLAHLPPDQPVYSFVLRRVPDRERIKGVGDLAAVGLEELANVTSSSCVLLGYSFGGLVAYEMAVRLAAAGRPPGLLGLLDTWHPPTPDPRRDLRDVVREVRRSYRRSWRAGVATTARATARVVRPPTPARAPTVAPQLSNGELLLEDRSLTAMYDAYRPPRYDGRVLLMTTEESVRRLRDDHLGWPREHSRQWTVAPVPGAHGTVMRSEMAPAVGKALASVLPREAPAPASRQ